MNSKNDSDFDKYASNYEGSISHPIRQLLESGNDNEFLRFKAKWLLEWWDKLGQGHRPKILDFGCGVGLLTKYLREFKPDIEVYGVDVSEGMIDQAKSRLPDAQFGVLRVGEQPFSEHRFDLVVMSGVLHHIPSAQWPETFSIARSTLKPDGRLVIFEHNPINPLTQFVVRTTPIDHDAQIKTASYVKRALKQSKFEFDGQVYLHFLPPTWRAFEKFERSLSWCPLGSQYAIWARLT